MPDTIIYLDPKSPLSLQNQIRQKLVDGILSGALPPGHRLPSSRKLAQQLDVARNTVVLAYQQLVAEGYLVSRARSGIFVNEQMLDTRVGFSNSHATTGDAEGAAWKKRTKRPGIAGRVVAQDLPNWNRYPYPFIDGKFDSSLFPLTEWREASRLALSVAEVNEWSTGSGDADDAMLIDDTVTLPIQINGKRRAEISVPKDMAKDEVEKTALAVDVVQKALNGAAPKKVIVVPGRIVNVVV